MNAKQLSLLEAYEFYERRMSKVMAEIRRVLRESLGIKKQWQPEIKASAV